MGLASNLAKLVGKISSGGLLSLSGLENTGADGQVLTRSGGAWSPQALPAGGVTSLNGQTGAITNNTWGAIGSYIGHYSPSYTNFGDTFAGSSIQVLDGAGTPISAGLTGTWRGMGSRKGATNNGNVAVRIA